MVRSYSRVEKTLREIASGSEVISLNEIGRIRYEPNGYNLYMIDITDKKYGSGRKKNVCISAGIHGDEPAGVEAVIRFLKDISQGSPMLRSVNITLFPCNNPYGYEAGQRTNGNGNDLNREFRRKKPDAEVLLIKRGLAGRSFDLSLELHEDIDSPGFYLYELKKTTEASFGKDIINIISERYPVNLGEEIEGMRARAGIISLEGSENEIKEMIQKRRRWPQALYQFNCGTRHCITCETPVNIKLEERANIHLLVLEYLLKRLGGITHEKA
ncbi:MAG TPA: M14 family metallocarboxypeptidase [Nitrospiria bacterium]|nr:M14 family metallocarboxypeptidase [Nitrospiria bacterium]